MQSGLLEGFGRKSFANRIMHCFTFLLKNPSSWRLRRKSACWFVWRASQSNWLIQMSTILVWFGWSVAYARVSSQKSWWVDWCCEIGIQELSCTQHWQHVCIVYGSDEKDPALWRREQLSTPKQKEETTWEKYACKLLHYQSRFPCLYANKGNLPDFLFDKNDAHRNNKTVDKGNAGANRDTTDDSNKPKMTDFMEWISKSYKNV